MESVCVTLVLHRLIHRLEFFLVDSVCIGMLFFWGRRVFTGLINWVIQVLVDQTIDSELLPWQEELTLVNGYFIFQWLNGKRRVYSFKVFTKHRIYAFKVFTKQRLRCSLVENYVPQTLGQPGKGFGVLWLEEKRAYILIMCQEKSKNEDAIKIFGLFWFVLVWIEWCVSKPLS